MKEVGEIKNIIPEGTRDFTMDECTKRNYISKKVIETFIKWGYREVVTPTIEFYETFNHKTQSLKEEEMYKFFDNRGRILVLRPDMTVPVARMVNTKLKDINLPIKLFYNASVFRVHESMEGKRNEYLDCGIELIGTKGIHVDLEVLVIAIEALKSIGVNNFKVEIGNVNILKSALSEMNLSEIQENRIIELVNRKSLINLKEFLEKTDIKQEHKEFLNKLPWLFGGYEMIQKVKEFSFSKKFKEDINYLQKIYMSLKNLGYEKYITVDMGMVPRLNYYSGIIFKGYVDGVGSTVLSGGRYDNLLENFGRGMEAIGFSIDINSLIEFCNYKEVKDIRYIEINEDSYLEEIRTAINITENDGVVETKYK